MSFIYDGVTPNTFTLMNRDRLQELFKLHLENRLPENEREEFYNYIYKMPDSERESLIAEFIDKLPVDNKLSKADSDLIFRRILKVVNRRRHSLIRYSLTAAASILLMVSGYYLADKYFEPGLSNNKLLSDLSPGGEKAVLQLADGSVVRLDNSKDSTLLEKDGSLTIKVQDNKLLYKNETKERDIKYNLLSTPRCGEFQMELPDGTNVKLNAESSIRFPDKFSSKERRVMITGEVYFEVSKTAGNIPFIVECGDKAKIEVLGTHFNVNSYDNEESIKTTLVEGSVKVSSSITNNSVIITPGQQAAIKNDGSLSVKEVDVDEAIAWRNGRFIFDKADIKTIMRQLERWYNVSVDYKGEFTQYFGGAISRKVNISKIFELFENTGDIKFELKDSLVTIYEK